MIARHYETGRWIEVALEGPRIASVTLIDGPDEITDSDDWLAPAFWDLQFNGRWGLSFSSPDLTVDQVAKIVRAQGALGAVRGCPTLITAHQADLLHGVRTIAEACDRFPDVNAWVLGIHLEGPSISEVDGYRGAHPLEAVRGPDWEEFLELREASRGRIAIITLAPERPGAIEFILRATLEGVVIALGHTSADGSTLQQAVEAGARLSTHLGNGIASTLDRHPNPIWDQAAEDQLWASLIADGHHLGPSVLKALVRAKTPERILLVSDASPLAGLPPGRYGGVGGRPFGQDRRRRDALSGRLEPGDRGRGRHPDPGRRPHARPGHRHREPPTGPPPRSPRALDRTGPAREPDPVWPGVGERRPPLLVEDDVRGWGLGRARAGCLIDSRRGDARREAGSRRASGGFLEG